MTLFGGHLALAGKPLPDWQHASTLSRFFAGAPQHLQNYHGPVSQSTTPVFLREIFDEVGEAARATAEEVSPHRCRRRAQSCSLRGTHARRRSCETYRARQAVLSRCGRTCSVSGRRAGTLCRTIRGRGPLQEGEGGSVVEERGTGEMMVDWPLDDMDEEKSV